MVISKLIIFPISQFLAVYIDFAWFETLLSIVFFGGGRGGRGGRAWLGTGDEGRERPSKRQFSNAFKQFSKAVIQISRQFPTKKLSFVGRSWDASQLPWVLHPKSLIKLDLGCIPTTFSAYIPSHWLKLGLGRVPTSLSAYIPSHWLKGTHAKCSSL